MFKIIYMICNLHIYWSTPKYMGIYATNLQDVCGSTSNPMYHYILRYISHMYWSTSSSYEWSTPRYNGGPTMRSIYDQTLSPIDIQTSRIHVNTICTYSPSKNSPHQEPMDTILHKIYIQAYSLHKLFL